MLRQNKIPNDIGVVGSFSPSMSIESLQKLIRENKVEIAPYKDAAGNKIPLMDEIIRRSKDLKNKELDQYISLKKWTLIVLLLFLAVETILIFYYSYLQATMLYNFKLQEWSYKLLVTATLLQITYMLQVAVKHLFPNK